MTIEFPDVADLMSVRVRDGGRDPADALDCWGLVHLVLDRAGIETPSYGDTLLAGEPGSIERVMSSVAVAKMLARERKGWPRVPLGQEQPLDVLLLRVMGRPFHVALVVGRSRMLHASFDTMRVTVEPYPSLRWPLGLIDAIHRHPALMP